MNIFKDQYNKLKNKIFGKAVDAILPRPQRMNQGPAKVKYLRSLFPNSVFTQSITPARAETIRLVYHSLRPEQKAIVRSRGWLKGVVQ